MHAIISLHSATVVSHLQFTDVLHSRQQEGSLVHFVTVRYYIPEGVESANQLKSDTVYPDWTHAEPRCQKLTPH